MADAKITQLTELTAPALEDLLPIVDDPSGTPITKKIALSNLFLDEDDMASNSATKGATQQSIKAYTDTQDTLYTNTNIGMARQAIINGNFDVAQRGASFTAPATGAYTLDQFAVVHSSDAVVDIKQTADAPTVAESGTYSTNCLHADVTTLDATIAAGQYYFIQHRIEGYNARGFGFGQAGTRYVTLSFWAKHTKTGTYCVAIRNAAVDRSYVAEYTISTTNTWEKKTITIPVDTTGTWLYTTGIGLNLTWAIAVGSTFHATANTWTAGNYFGTSSQVNGLDSASNDFKIAQVQLCAGSVALPFQPKSYEEELRACQRYGLAVTGELRLTYAVSANQIDAFISTPVKMRTFDAGVVPAVSVSSTPTTGDTFLAYAPAAWLTFSGYTGVTINTLGANQYKVSFAFSGGGGITPPCWGTFIRSLFLSNEL